MSDSAIKTFQKLFEDTVMSDKVTSYVADIAYSWKVVALSSLSAIILGYLYLFIIRCVGGIIIWLSILLIQASLIAGGYMVYQ